MTKQTEDSKTSKKEVLSNENAELNEEALEQVNGGALKLTTEKTETRAVKDNKGNDWIHI